MLPCVVFPNWYKVQKYIKFTPKFGCASHKNLESHISGNGNADLQMQQAKHIWVCPLSSLDQGNVVVEVQQRKIPQNCAKAGTRSKLWI